MREIVCPLCALPTYVEEMNASQEVHCQQCAGAFAALPASREPATAQAGSTGPDFSAIEADVFVPEGLPASPNAVRTCPICGAENEPRSRDCSYCEEPLDTRGSPGMVPRASAVRSLSQGFGDAWAIYKRSFGLYMGAWVVAAVISIGSTYLMTSVLSDRGVQLPQGGWRSIAWFAKLCWGLYWQLGLSRLALNLCRKDSPALPDVLIGVYRLIHAVAATISIWTVFATVIGLAVGLLAMSATSTAIVVIATVGLYMLLFPLVLAVQLGVCFSLMDRSLNVGVFGSLRLTFEMIGRNFIGVYVLSFCCAVALVAANFALVFPLIFVVPYLFLVFAVTYLKASGQASSVALSAPGAGDPSNRW